MVLMSGGVDMDDSVSSFVYAESNGVRFGGGFEIVFSKISTFTTNFQLHALKNVLGAPMELEKRIS